jgi:hypothetical protein
MSSIPPPSPLANSFIIGTAVINTHVKDLYYNDTPKAPKRNVNPRRDAKSLERGQEREGLSPVYIGDRTSNPDSEIELQ